MKYRPELDGLRAIAILGVVFAHFQLAPIYGGFAGVDVFFVLSGFLITAILLQDGPERRSLSSFYAARFWRIMPAYLCVIGASLAIAPLILISWDQHRLAASALASAFLVPNIYFNDDLGYFTPAAIYTPLLHLWSLGVEAQFYLLWPLGLLAARRLPRRRLAALIAGVAALGLLASTIAGVFDNKFAFFSMPSRLWEFAAGAFVAVRPIDSYGPRAQTVLRRLAAPALLALAVALVILRDDWLWPGPWALGAVLPTALLILATDRAHDRVAGGARRLLSSRPLVWLGGLSYSLYLVHWPVLVFGGYARFPHAPLALRWALLAGSVVLAVALHLWVENPLRRFGRAFPARGARAALRYIAPSVLLGLGSFLIDSATRADVPKFALACVRLNPDGCLIGPAGVKPRVALWGDSHAGHLSKGLGDLLSARGQSLALFATGSCPPLAGVEVAANAMRARTACFRRNATIWSALLSDRSIETVVLAARWSGYVESRMFGAVAGSRYFLATTSQPTLDLATTRLVFVQALARTVRDLQQSGKRVILSDEAPDLGFDGYRCARLVAPADAQRICSTPRPAVDENERLTDSLLTQGAPGILHVDPRSALCDDRRCVATRDGTPLYRDEHHLTLQGSDFVAQKIFAQAFIERRTSAGVASRP